MTSTGSSRTSGPPTRSRSDRWPRCDEIDGIDPCGTGLQALGNVGSDDAPRRTPSTLPWALGAATVLAEIAYPLVGGTFRATLTVVTVLLFCATLLTHAVLTRGARWAVGFAVVTAGGGLLAEAVGVHTGMPFGRYAYRDSLGPELVGVPIVVPLAWTMMAYPTLLVGQRVAASPRTAALVGGLALAAWDLFLDPQMVDAGHWRWDQGGPALSGIPLTNAVGWTVVGVLMMSVLQALPRREADARLPYALYVWTFASSLLANLAFFHRPEVALTGGVGMGIVVVLLVRALRHR